MKPIIQKKLSDMYSDISKNVEIRKELFVNLYRDMFNILYNDIRNVLILTPQTIN